MRLVLLCITGLLLASPPASATWNIYFSNIHSHTAYSDGIGTPAEAYDHAKNVANIDILGVSDHTHYLTAAEWSDEIYQAAAATVPGEFVGLCSQEFGLLSASGFGHLGIFDVDYMNPNSRYVLSPNYAWIIANNGFGMFNHPTPDASSGSNFENLAYYPQYDAAVSLIEVRNGKRADNYEAQYNQALANGWHVSPTGDQDNHEGMWGDQQNTSSGNDIYLSGVIAESLTTTSVLDALRNHRTYAVEVNPPNDRIFCLYWGDGQIMGSEIEVANSVNLSAQAWTQTGVTIFSAVQVVDNGVAIYTEGIFDTSLNWSRTIAVTPGTQHYIYLKIFQVDGDLVWTAPIWVNASLLLDAETPPPAEGFALLQNAPNPFVHTTRIEYSVPPGGVERGRLAVYDVSGREVCVLREGSLPGGPDRVEWNGRDAGGRPAPAGVYVYRFDLPGHSASRKLLLLP
jgi:hypothetical protein